MLKKLIVLSIVLFNTGLFAEDKIEIKCRKKINVLKRKYKKAQIKQFKSTIAKYKALQKKTLQAKDLEGAIKIKKIIARLKKQLKSGDFSDGKMPSVDEKKVENSSKVVNVGETDFDGCSVLCYNGGRWQDFPLSRMQTKVSQGSFEVINTTGIHSFAKLIFPYNVCGDFSLSFDFTGYVRTFEFQAKSRNDEAMFIEPASSGSGKSTLSITRSGSDVETKINGQDVMWESWHGSFDNSVFCISVGSNKQFTISNVVYKVKGQLDEPVEFNGHYYKFVPGKYTWKQAKAICEKAGGHLACIGDEEENSFVVTLTKGSVAWLGGTDKGTEGKWRWVNGDKFSYTNWDLKRKEPNGGRLENCLAIGGPRTSSRSHWNDATKKGSKVWGIDGFVCEWDKAPK